MKREIITIDEYGRLNIPTDTVSVWMTEAELIGMFDATARAVNSAIKAIIKSDALNDTRSANVSVWTVATVRTCITWRSS